MAKANPLVQGLDRKRAAKKKAAKTTTPEVAYRTGRVLVAGHFESAVQRQLKIMAAEKETTVQALLAEAINMLFAKNGEPEIARAGPVPVKEDPVAEVTN